MRTATEMARLTQGKRTQESRPNTTGNPRKPQNHVLPATLIGTGLSIGLTALGDPVKSQSNPPPGAVNSSLWVGPNPPSTMPIGTTNITNSLNVGGDVSIQGNLTAGSQTINGNTDTSGNAIVGGNAAIKGTLSSGRLTVKGDSSISGNQVVNGALIVGTLPDLPPLPGEIWINGKKLLTTQSSRRAGGTALGLGAKAEHAGSTAIGDGAQTTTSNQVAIGKPGSRLTLPGVASGGKFAGSANQDGPTRLLTTDGEGNIGTSSFDPSAITGSIRALGQAVTSSGAIASAFSAVPQVVASEEETMRCGSGLGGYGSSYAAALGCSVKLNPKSPIHVNAAIAFTNPVDYQYGTSPGYAGRVGISFPLGARNKASTASKQEEISALKNQIIELRSMIEELGHPVSGKTSSF